METIWQKIDTCTVQALSICTLFETENNFDNYEIRRRHYPTFDASNNNKQSCNSLFLLLNVTLRLSTKLNHVDMITISIWSHSLSWTKMNKSTAKLRLDSLMLDSCVNCVQTWCLSITQRPLNINCNMGKFFWNLR